AAMQPRAILEDALLDRALNELTHLHDDLLRWWLACLHLRVDLVHDHEPHVNFSSYVYDDRSLLRSTRAGTAPPISYSRRRSTARGRPRSEPRPRAPDPLPARTSADSARDPTRGRAWRRAHDPTPHRTATSRSARRYR